MLFRIIRGFFTAIVVSSLFLVFFLVIKYFGLPDFNFSQNFLGKILGNLPSFYVKIPGDMREDLLEKPADFNREIAVKVGLFADAEGDWKNLEKSLNRMEDLSVDVVFFLGDLTRWGSKDDLLEGKAALENSKLLIYVLPGDHDLAASVLDGDILGLKNFGEVFGEYNHLYKKEGYTFLLFNNSANFSTITDADFDFFTRNIATADFVILSQPLYHPFSSRIMGVVDGKEVSNVSKQSQKMLDLIRNSKVKAIISADQHMFSNSFDPEKSSLRHIVIGALVSNSEEIRNPQAPRFAILDVFTDGTFRVVDMVL